MKRRQQSLKKRQRGFVLITLVALMTMGALYFFISNLTPTLIQAQRLQLTNEALTQAREALIGYAVRYREDQASDGQLDRVYGYFPLPDLGSSRNNNATNPDCYLKEGCEAYNFSGNAANTTVIGRFPWRTLGTEPLKDSDGECLWYALSGSHQRQQLVEPMNWDTLSQLDIYVANGTAAMVSAVTSAHDRPIAVIFSPGPPLAGQDRTASVTDSVTACGGNYLVSNYLDPVVATDLGGISNYLAGTTNNASGDTSATIKALSAGGSINRRSDASLWPGKCPPNDTSTCSTPANDVGTTVTSEQLFRTLRGSRHFRTDINAMLDRMVGCLRDEIIAAGGSLATPYAKIAGADANPCYGKDTDPLGYYPNYKEMIFVAAPAGGVAVTVDGTQLACSGALLFAGQRDTKSILCPKEIPTNVQMRSTGAEQLDACNYLEAPNLANFTGNGIKFYGPSQFAQVSANQTISQDIVRCIPSEESFAEAPSILATADDLIRYDPATRTLTLGRQNVESDQGFAATSLTGCAWTPEVRATGSGFRSYFKFNISDSGDGFVFAAVDGDNNATTVCGAGEQHLGYSGNNGGNAPIAYPKIGLEFDTRRNFRSNPPFLPDGFDPSRIQDATTMRTLNNGRADPSYSGGHIGLVYWGGETSISTGIACGASNFCRSPSFCDTTDSICKLNPEEDDNVHGQLPAAPAVRPPPTNQAAPAVPPTDPAYPPFAVDKLDPSLSSVPRNQDIHVRVEVARSTYAGRDDNSRLVKLVASANLGVTLSGLPTIDGVTPVAGDTVLVTAQTDAKTNGVYVANAGIWARASNASEGADLPPGTSWFIKDGTAHSGSLWRLQNTEPPVVGISELVIQQFREAVKAVANTNLTLAGLQTVNGVALAAGDRVLLTGQTDTKQNGVYVASAGGWSRAVVESAAAGMKDGATWFSSSGAGSYWRLSGDATPGTSAISISALSFPSNDIYGATVTTQVWKETSNVDQIARMKITTRSMNQLDPVTKHGVCLADNTCPATNPVDQSCGGVEIDTFRYCYTGQKPKLYDSQKIFDIRSTTSCASQASCSGKQFCGIDKVCYQPALRTTRLGFTGSQSLQDQELTISNFFTTWLP